MNDTRKPWESDEDFNAEKAWTLIQNLRDEVTQVKARRDEIAAERDTAVANAAKVLEERDSHAQALEAKTASEADALSKLAAFESLRAKENLLMDAGLPRDLAANVTGESEEEWMTSVERFASLRGNATQERRPDPAQAATDTPDVNPREEYAAQIFGA